METFWIKPRLYFGDHPLSALRALEGKRVLIVTDAFLSSSGLLEPVKAELKNCEIRIFDRVEPDPSLRLVASGVREMRAFQPDVVLAFGGGSPIDCAKGMRHFAEIPCTFWAIPTTAGTGSEVTSFAVLTDTDKGVKYPMVDDALLPDTAVLDPSLLDGVPPKVTADTGMDVLTHAAEAYVARDASALTDALAEKAFSLAYTSLPKAFQGDRGAKADMLMASCLAGLAFNAAGLGVCHSMAHALGGRFHVAHGRLNAMLLPHVIGFNAEDPTAAEKYGQLAKRCGIASNPRVLAAALTRLRINLKIPARLEVPAGELREALPSLAAAALADVCLPGNPRTVSAQDVEAMLRELNG